MVYVAFVIDVYARFIVGWRVSRTAHAGFVLDGKRRLRPIGYTGFAAAAEERVSF
jgi:transposase InsO family protein